MANLEWSDLNVSATWVDHEKTTRPEMKFLADLGHRRIAYLGLASAHFFYAQSHRGYLAGLADVGLPACEAHVALCPTGPLPLNGYFAVRDLLQQSDPPTAIVGARDGCAHGACQAIEEAGLRVGRDVSVVGVDDVTWPHEEKFLTTFREPCHEMGAAAVRILIERVVHGWQPPEKREIEAPFILRRSAGPLMVPNRS